jgi:hypothetical protein
LKTGTFQMEPQIHENYIKSSNLQLWSMGLTFIITIIIGSTGSNGFAVLVGILSMIVAFVLALLTRQGYEWMKIVLTVLCGIALLFEPFTLVISFNNNPLVGFINITQCVLQVTAVVKLYRIPADWKPEVTEEEEIETEEEGESDPPINSDYEIPENYGKL